MCVLLIPKYIFDEIDRFNWQINLLGGKEEEVEKPALGVHV